MQIPKNSRILKWKSSEKYAKDKKAPKNAVKVVAITTNEELLVLEEV